ncbi:ADP-ribosylation factor-like protein 15 [Myotis davidii]|uniref:ADP-ribosylation factor-like protein 15 n=1 Tax=Myotis davidii TaxID=225400 RepID=L5LZ93_MYODS|nr:ADP-ribosylation factor-like protein 15 [Myotis davidii]
MGLCVEPEFAAQESGAHGRRRAATRVKKYFELEPLARGQRWILQPCSLGDVAALKDSFSRLIQLLEEKDQEAARM